MKPHALDALTLIIPYYRNPAMLAVQLKEWFLYPPQYRFIVIDDGSPEHARPIIEAEAHADVRSRLQLYRIGKDIPWNRGGARNLGAHVARTEWIAQLDIDHVLPFDSAQALMQFAVDPRCWYRFHRFRRGRADDTRRKDKIPDTQEFGPVKPHGDSYLCRRALYWKIGGYDEDYSGCLGGGTPFLTQLEHAAPFELLPAHMPLHVYTRDVVADASVSSLSRDTSEYTRRRKLKEATGNTRARNPLRFPWERVL